jgi:predicted SAM-dependent methyltransferase
MEFEREYFDGEVYDLYLDFPTHWNTVDQILKRKPESMIDIGGARGYISKHIEEAGIPSHTMDISRWAHLERVTKNHTQWDARITPWPFTDNTFDIGFSISFLEHIAEEYIPAVVAEMIRISRRGLHGVTYEITNEDNDPTHITMHPQEWWEDQFRQVDPNYPVEICEKNSLEHYEFKEQLPKPKYEGIKLNLGCYLDQFYYGWTNVDILPLHKHAEYIGTKFMQYDIRLKIRELTDTVDCVVMSHVLEHLTRKEGVDVLKEIYRVLKPGGYLRISTPDLYEIAQTYVHGTISDFGVFNASIEKSTDDALSFWNLIFGGHKTIYDFSGVRQALQQAGFKDIYHSPFDSSRSEIIKGETFDLHPAISIYVECTKPR